MKTITVPIIKNDEDLKAALSRIEDLLRSDDAEADDEIQVLGLLIHAYEAVHVKFSDPDPIQVLQFVMEERGLKDKDLIPFLGSQPRVSDVLRRKRRLTVEMIRRLSEGLGIPAAALISSGDKAAVA